MLYDIVLIVHIAAWTSWMAGLFYLPRLFVYHAERAAHGSEMAATFGVMQQKLYRLIMSPAMMAAWVTGLFLAWSGGWFSSGWVHAKILLVIGLTVFHVFCKRWMLSLAAGDSDKTGRFFRIANEVPTLIFLVIVALAILKPF